MPNIRSQRVDANGVEIVGSDGRTLTVTRQQLLAQFQAASGNPAARKAAALTWLRGQMAAALGAEMVPPTLLDLDFDTATGRPTVVAWRSLLGT